MIASISDFNDRQPPGELGCAACGARLAHDQRYCVQCGERRGPLPPHVAEALAARFEQGREPVPSPAPSADQSRPRVAPRPAISWFPSTRVAAIAVLGMLAFGVAVGSAVGGGVTSLASAPLLILAQQSQPAVAPTSSAAGSDSSGGAGDSGGSGSQTVQTVTVTSTGAQPQSPTPASSNSGSGTNTTAGSGGGGSTNALGLPPIKHVFLIVLSGRGYSQTFEPGSSDTYLSKTLPAQGEVLPDYYAVTAGPLANEIALISGQGPTLQTAANCPVFTNLVPGSVGQHGQALGAGCVYPPAVQTLADQFDTAGLRWKAYIQGLPPGAADGCQHPTIGAADAPPPTREKPYATWRNPFVYFQSLTASTSCSKDEVELSRLGLDLQAAKTTPAFSYIVADPCNDGADTQCGPAPGSTTATASTAGATTSTTTSSTASSSTTAVSATTTPSSAGAAEPPGLAASDNFLKSVLPEIESSEAYKADGLIAITFDQAPQSGPYADSSSCCSNPTFPNLPSGSATTTTPGAATDPATGAQTPTTTTATETTTTATQTTTVPTSSTASSTTTTPAAGTTTSSTTPAAGPTTSTTTTPASAPASTGTGESSPTGGGGQVGMLLLSRYVKPRTVNVTAYFNHFSLLKTVEAIFGLKYLGYAGVLEVPPFDSSVFNAAP